MRQKRRAKTYELVTQFFIATASGLIAIYLSKYLYILDLSFNFMVALMKIEIPLWMVAVVAGIWAFLIKEQKKKG